MTVMPLRRLGVERIDLYQFHWPDLMGTPVEDSWAEMLRLVEEGKVRPVGSCTVRGLRSAGSCSPGASPILQPLTDSWTEPMQVAPCGCSSSPGRCAAAG